MEGNNSVYDSDGNLLVEKPTDRLMQLREENFQSKFEALVTMAKNLRKALTSSEVRSSFLNMEEHLSKLVPPVFTRQEEHDAFLGCNLNFMCHIVLALVVNSLLTLCSSEWI
jgi:hypothetical protein